MKPSCPACEQQIPRDQINVEKDVAYCPRCGEVYALSALVSAADASEVDLNDPPGGAWFSRDIDGFTVGATTRSALGIFLVPFTIVWAGGSMGGIYGSQIVRGEFNPALSLFGVPFLLGSMLLISVCLMSVCGKVVVTVNGDDGRVFQGVGPLGWTRRFAWSGIQRIEEQSTAFQYSGQQGAPLSLVGKTRLKFGSMVREARRYFILQALRLMLLERKPTR